METWKEIAIGLALGIISLSGLINIGRFITGRDDAVVNIYGADAVEFPTENRVLNIETLTQELLEEQKEGREEYVA